MSIYDNEAENIEFLARGGGRLCSRHDPMAGMGIGLSSDYSDDCVECNPAAKAHWEAHVAACRAAGRWTRYETERERAQRERHEEYVRVHGPINYGICVKIPESSFCELDNACPELIEAAHRTMQRRIAEAFDRALLGDLAQHKDRKNGA